ncbi:protein STRICTOSIDINE SYNTHASE-LIKE 3-like [Carex rostrata]
MADAVRVVLRALVVTLAVYCATDPFRQSSMVDFPGFETYFMYQPDWSEVPSVRDTEDKLQKAEIWFHNQIQGPESIAFDPLGHGPYTGLADGRVVFWDGSSIIDFAYTSPNRSELCDPKPSAFSYLKTEHICGRPLGLRFNKKTGDLYIADAYFGLLKVGPEGGLATSLATEADGVPFKFTNDLDLDEDGNVYFTDSSTRFQRRNFIQQCLTGEPTGRLLKYNPKEKEATVLLRDLYMPNGVSMSKDKSFLVFCEGPLGRLSRYWLKGEKAGTSEVFVILHGFPDNVRTNDKGEFWVALHFMRNAYTHFFSRHPGLRKIVLKLPIPARYQYLALIGGRLHGAIVKYSPEGELLEILEDRQGKVVKAVSEVEEKDGKLWMGSVLMPFVAVY